MQLILAGALLWVSGLTWGSVQGEFTSQEFAGSDLDSFIFAVGAVSLAVVIGVLATRTWGRRILGTLGAVISGVGIYSLVMLEKSGLNGLWVVAIVLSTGLVVTNVLIALASKNWPTLSGKYSRSTPPEQDTWALLDAGVDPTLESNSDKGPSHD